MSILSCGHVSVLKLLTCQQDKETAVGNYEACYRSIKRLKRTPAKLYGMWQATQKCELTIRPDDPVRIRTEDTSEQPFFDIVVFSDFGCPSCARFAELLDRSIGRLFADRVRVTYKHYPLDRTCNRDRTCRGGAPQTLHPYACDAARMAEAARRLEGNEGFWRAHDFLHENRERLARGELDPGQFAGELGIDPRALREAVDSQIVASRVEQDVSQAKGCGVFATPSVFIEGKLVDPLEVMEIGFWNEMAERYWNEIGEPRPESTKLPGIRLIRR